MLIILLKLLINNISGLDLFGVTKSSSLPAWLMEFLKALVFLQSF